MVKSAIMWIRDGVLIERMHINAVAFAYAMLVSPHKDQHNKKSLEDLINFAFEKSGISCAEKVNLYNSECEDIVSDPQLTVTCYNLIANEAAKKANYFDGAIELLRDLKSGGTSNFITSALEQDILDTWLDEPQGRQIAGCMNGVLGKRGDFTKGHRHFQYVSELGYERIYYVADAILEIIAAKKCAREFNLVPVGFGNEITIDTIVDAARRVDIAARSSMQKVEFWANLPISPTLSFSIESQLDTSKIKIADKTINLKLLAEAGAEVVIKGEKSTLMPNLRQYFESENLLIH